MRSLSNTPALALVAVLLLSLFWAPLARAQATGENSNPTSVLTRPNNTSTYAQNNLVASNATAGSVVVPSFGLVRAGGIIPRVRLSTNVTTGWGAAPFTITLWALAPTYTNGDRGAYAVATGAANFVAQYNVVLSQFADGAAGVGAITVGNFATVQLYQGRTVLYWDIQYTGAATLTPIALQTFTLTPEVIN